MAFDIGRLKRTAGVVRVLRALGVGGLAADLLEAGPLAFLGAQALIMAEPSLALLGAGDEAAELAEALQNPHAARALARRLSETPPA